MFTLRRISGDGVQINHSLGNSYTVIDRFLNYEEFKKTFKIIFDKNHVADLDDQSDYDTKNVHAFVSNENGSYIQPLYTNQKAYIMTGNGQTFDNLSFR
jgi:hypothetical protein